MDSQQPLPILFPKVQIPPPRLQRVTRQRLIQVLDQGLHRKLTLISAPAGYGKSTLLSEWAAACEWRLAWVTLAAGDNDIERFLAYLISAMQTAGLTLSDLDGILAARFSLQPMPPEAILAILVNEVSLTGERLVVVLDDFHLIENREIHAFLNELLANLPSNIHIILSTRSEPPLHLARLRAKDQLNEITESDLRFTPEETRRFFEDVMGLHLTLDQIAEVEKRTEGWVTALQLVALSLKDRKNPRELIDTLAGTHRYILDYLVDEVFSDLPQQLQSFLMKVSILERLNPDLCDAVANEPDEQNQSKKILEFMDASNLFVIPLDSQRQWYRFHSLFAEFLQDRFSNQQSDQLSDLHRRAAGWYTSHHFYPEAIKHSFAGGNVELAADLIQSQAKDLLTRGEIRTLNRWVDDLPEDAIQARPQLMLARAWGMLMRDPVNFWKEVGKHTDHIAESFGIAITDLADALAESQPGSERRAGLSEFAMLLAYANRDVSDVKKPVALFNAALEYLPEDDQLLRGFTFAGLASTYARSGAVKRAEETFAQGAKFSLAANSIYGYVACTDWQATMQVEQGQLTSAADLYHQAIEKLSSQGKSPLPLSGHVFVGLASVLLEWNDLEGALENVQTGLQIGNQVKDIDALLKGYVILARIYQGLGNEDELENALLESERTAQGTSEAGCMQEARAWKAQLALFSGELQEAQRWAAERGLAFGESSQLPGGMHEIEILTYVRLLMAVGKSARAVALLAEMAAQQEQTGRMKVLIEILLLQALCFRALARMEEAVRSLARALLLAEPEGFIRIFIQEGTSMAALLRTARSQGHSPEYVTRLLEAFGETPALEDALLDPLSERELEVLHLIAEGLTNAEITAQLVVEQSTVKTHINRIYRKLGVTTRTQAVARARQLRIL